MKKLIPILKRYRFFLMFFAVNIALLVIAPETASRSFELTGDNLLEMASILPPIFILLGLLDAWVQRETMIKYMGHGSGVRGGVFAFILGAAAASGVSGQFIIHIVGHGVDQELCLAPTLLVQDRGYLLVAWVTGIELDGKSEGILLFAHMDHLLVFVAAYKRPYPAALAPISSTKMAVPTLPDFSICFRSSREPPPTK